MEYKMERRYRFDVAAVAPRSAQEIPTAASAPPHPPLSRRECDVLQLFLQYDNADEVADVLCVSVYTVKKHLLHIYRKLRVRTLHRAIVKALVMGLIDLKAVLSSHALGEGQEKGGDHRP